MKNLKCFAFLCALFLAAGNAAAGEITFSGSITQSTADGTGPAVNNPSLNFISDGDTYTVTLDFAGAITTTGFYNLTGATLVFSDPTASATENAFGSVNIFIATDSTNSTLDDITLQGCLTTGSACDLGNQLDAYFSIPAADLNSQNVLAGTIPNLSPQFELQEDDSATNIFGTVITYSYSSVVATPDPSLILLLGINGLIALGCMFLRRRRWPLGQA